MKPQNVKQLVLNLRHHPDPQVFAKIYDGYAPKIYRFIFFKVNDENDAQDLTSEVFLRAWSAIREKGVEVERFTAFLYRIARNAVIDHYRTRKQNVTIENVRETEIENFVAHTPLESLENVEDLALVHKALGSLKEEYRELVVLRYIDELSIMEIAQIIGKNAIATRVAVHRAMQALKKILNRLST